MRGLLRLLIAAALSTTAVAGSADAPADPAVKTQVEAANAAFWEAFNRCDAAAMTPEFTDDIEFYHDKTGLTLGRPAVVKSMIDGPCGDPSHVRLRREEVPGSTRFAPLAGGFALLSGEHRFLVSRDGGDFRHEGLASYVELWRQTAAGWQMRRVVSYDHRADLPDLRAVDMPAQKLAELAGAYIGDPSGPLTVTMADGRLTVASGRAVFELVPLGNGLFGVADRWVTFAFDGRSVVVRDEGKIVATAHRD